VAGGVRKHQLPLTPLMAYDITIMPAPHRPPLAVRRALQRLGRDLRTARLRRGLTMETVASRAFTNRATLRRVENGDPGVGSGIYVSVINALGLLEQLSKVADPVLDEVGLARADEALPKRARPRGTRRSEKQDE
jgi:transcriptional regulator with XRE-family HTH domain